MLWLVVAGGLLIAAAVVIREYQLAKEREGYGAAFADLTKRLEKTQARLQRTTEDIYVLKHVLAERHLLDNTELARARIRLVEHPKRQAQERRAILQNTEIGDDQLVLDTTPDNVH